MRPTLLFLALFAPFSAVPASDSALASGPMATWATSNAAGLWLQTTRPATVQLRLVHASLPGGARLTEPVATTRAADLIARIEVDELQPGTELEYELYLDGQRVLAEQSLRLVTPEVWRWRGQTAGAGPHAPPELTILLGSCAYRNDPDYDRPGRSYGGGDEIFDAMAKERPDLTLWLGDNVYYRADDWESEASMRRRYAHSRADPALQALLRRGRHVAIWDDHDYGPNDSDRSFRLKATALQVFRDYWPDLVFGTDDTPGVFRSLPFYDLEFFLTDNRYHRAPEAAPETPDKGMLGASQAEWLLDGLRSSRATFRLVAGGGQMISPIARFEGWADFPAEHSGFLDALQAEGIEGLLFLSGDRHQSEFLKLQREGHWPWYELTCSPLTAGAVTTDGEADNPARVAGSWFGQRNYGRIQVLGPDTARRLRLSLHAADGSLLWEREIARDELGPAN